MPATLFNRYSFQVYSGESKHLSCWDPLLKGVFTLFTFHISSILESFDQFDGDIDEITLLHAF